MGSDPFEGKLLRDRIAALTSLLRRIEISARDGTGPPVEVHPRYALLRQMQDRLLTRLEE